MCIHLPLKLPALELMEWWSLPRLGVSVTPTLVEEGETEAVKAQGPVSGTAEGGAEVGGAQEGFSRSRSRCQKLSEGQ